MSSSNTSRLRPPKRKQPDMRTHASELNRFRFAGAKRNFSAQCGGAACDSTRTSKMWDMTIRQSRWGVSPAAVAERVACLLSALARNYYLLRATMKPSLAAK